MNYMLTKPDRVDTVIALVVLSFAIAALYFVLFFLLQIISIIDLDSGGSPISNWPLIPARRRELSTLGSVLLLSMAFSFLLGVGLSTMRNWVRIVGSVGYILLAIWQLITIFTGTHYYTNSVVVGPVLSIIFVGVLNSRAVKQAFN
ncbi:MAG TPA: hypothetical protein VEW94_12610 [Chloroflexia bacterium]|nr:hypothetical protein [Chloroflexia bacterium]